MKPRLAGLHLQLLGLVFLPFSLFLLVVAIGGVQIHSDAMRQLVAERDERASRAAASAISQQLRHRDFAIRGLAARAQQADAEVTLRDSLFLTEDFDQGLAILDHTGKVLASSVEASRWDDRPVKQLLEVDSSGGAVFSDPFQENSRLLVLVLAKANNGLAVGVFDVESLIRSALLTTVASGGDSMSFVTDSAGNLLQYIGNRPETDPPANHPGIEAALRGEHGSFYQPASDGEHVVAFSPIQPTNWSLIIEEPWRSVSSPILDISLIAPLVLVPALVVTLVGLWFGATQVIRPLRNLQDRAEGMEGVSDTGLEEPVGGIAEIRSLQQTLVQMADRLRAAQVALRSYISAITRAQEDERQRMARELHDETIQDLIAIDQRIQIVSSELADSKPDLAAQLKALRSEVSRSVGEVRRLVRALRPIYLEDLGLITALEMLAKDLESEQKIPVKVQIDGNVQRLYPDVELAIYRIFQEALNNVARHSNADSAWVRLAFRDDGIHGEVGDDGEGFAVPTQPSSLAASELFGLMGMYERAELIGAKLEIISSRGGGTRVSISLPITAS